MQLAGPGVWGPPRDSDGAVAVLREAIAGGVNHIDTSDYYGPHVTNQIIRRALHPYPAGLVIVTKLGGRRPPDKSWQPAISAQDLTAGVHDNLRNLGLDALDIVNYRFMGTGHGPEEGSIAEQVTVLADLRLQGANPPHRPEQRHGRPDRRGTGDHRSRVRTEQLQSGFPPRRCPDRRLGPAGHRVRAVLPARRSSRRCRSSTLSSVAGRLPGFTPMATPAWLLHRSPNILLIPGTSSVAHLRENLAAGQLTLSPQTLAELDGITAAAVNL